MTTDTRSATAAYAIYWMGAVDRSVMAVIAALALPWMGADDRSTRTTKAGVLPALLVTSPS